MIRKTTKIKSLVFLSLVFLVSLALTACGSQKDKATIDPSTVQMTNYAHQYSGMVFKVPTAWPKKTEDKQKVIFANPAGTVSFSGVFELAGYSYYTPEEQGEIAEKICKKSLKNVKVLQSQIYNKKNNSYKMVMQGEDAKAETAICEAVVYAPLDGVRYYLVALAGVDDYKKYYKVFEEMFSSFYLSIDEDTLYSKINANKTHVQAQ